MKPLIDYHGKTISDLDITKALRSVGLKSGDTACVHSELIAFGKPIVKKDEFLSSLIDCFWEVLGDNATLVMPTFTYSFCDGKIYDKLLSKGKMGALNEFFREQPNVVRTDDPIFSFAIGGKDKELYLKESKSCFDSDSVYATLLANKAKLILFGNPNKGFTFSHFVEESAGVDYRFYKEFTGDMIDENGIKTKKSIKYYVRDTAKRSIIDIDKNINLLKSSNNFRDIKIGGASIVLINLKEYYDTLIEALSKDKMAII